MLSTVMSDGTVPVKNVFKWSLIYCLTSASAAGSVAGFEILTVIGPLAVALPVATICLNPPKVTVNAPPKSLAPKRK